MARRLRNNVHLTDPGTGIVTIWHPEDDIPADVAELITNPGAWVDVEPQPAEVAPAPAAPQVTTTTVDSQQEPPESGPGSGVAAWREYAGQVGVEVDKDAHKKDVIAAVRAHQEEQLEEPAGDDSGEPDRETGTVEEWRAYAEDQGLDDLPEDATVEDIIAAVDQLDAL